MVIAIGQSEEDGAQDVNQWNEGSLVEEVLTEEDVVDKHIPLHLDLILKKDMRAAKDILEYVQKVPSMGSTIHKDEILRVYSYFQIGGEGIDSSLLDQGDPGKIRRSVKLMNLVFNTMVPRCDYLLTVFYSDVLNVSRPCWYAQLFLLYLGNHVASVEQ